MFYEKRHQSKGYTASAYNYIYRTGSSISLNEYRTTEDDDSAHIHTANQRTFVLFIHILYASVVLAHRKQSGEYVICLDLPGRTCARMRMTICYFVNTNDPTDHLRLEKWPHLAQLRQKRSRDLLLSSGLVTCWVWWPFEFSDKKTTSMIWKRRECAPKMLW